MKLLLIIFLSINLFAQNKLDFDSRFGFLSNGTLLSNFKDAQSALSDWLEEIASNNKGKVEVVYYDNSASLYEDYKNKKLNMIVLELSYFFKHYDEIKPTAYNYWTLSSNNIKYLQYYLIANKKLKAKGFKDIKNKTLSIKKQSDTALTWLDKSSLVVNNKSYKDILRNIKYEDKQSNALLDVFFKKTDFAVVSKDTWDIMIELNPAIKKRVEIIEKSKPLFIPFVGFFSHSASKKGVDAFFSLSENIKALDGGEQIINILKYDAVETISENTLNKLEMYYDDYFKLKSRYD